MDEPTIMGSLDNADSPPMPLEAALALRTLAALKQVRAIADELNLPPSVRALLAGRALDLLERVNAVDLARLEREAIDAGDLDAPAAQ